MQHHNIQVKVLNPKLGSEISLTELCNPWFSRIRFTCLYRKSLEILPGTTHLIPTGLAVYIGNPTLAGVILPRSGLGHKHGIVLGNLVGLIDSDYQGELMISCWNSGLGTV